GAVSYLPSFPTRRSSDLASKQPIMVLEDDAQIFPTHFKEFLRSISLLPNSVECVRLFENKARNNQYYPVMELGSLQLGKYLRGRSEEHTSELQSRENIVC